MPLHVLPRAKKPAAKKKTAKSVVRPSAAPRKKVTRPQAAKKR